MGEMLFFYPLDYTQTDSREKQEDITLKII